MKRIVAAWSLGFALAGIVSARAAEWPCYRGPGHDGVSPEQGWQKVLQAPPKELWSQDVGAAYSSFACVDGKVYTCGTLGDTQTLYCLEADTGRSLWRTGFEAGYRDRRGDGTRSTPTVDRERVFVVGALGRLVCLDAAKGTELWSRRLGKQPFWGHSASVLVEDDVVIVAAGTQDGALVAYDKRSGRVIWGAGKDQPGYATPYPFVLQGRRYVAGFLANSVVVADVERRREVWSMPWIVQPPVSAASPIFAEGCLYLSSAYGKGAALVRLAPRKDKLTHEEVWLNREVQNRFSPMVLHDGHLYGQIENAVACVRFDTGEIRWQAPRPNWGNVLLADGHLLVLTGEGRLEIAKADPAGYRPLASVQLLGGPCWAAPVLYRGRLYVRNTTTVKCFDLSR